MIRLEGRLLSGKKGARRLPIVEEHQLVGIVTDRDNRLFTNSPVILWEK